MATGKARAPGRGAAGASVADAGADVGGDAGRRNRCPRMLLMDVTQGPLGGAGKTAIAYKQLGAERIHGHRASRGAVELLASWPRHVGLALASALAVAGFLVGVVLVTSWLGLSDEDARHRRHCEMGGCKEVHILTVAQLGPGRCFPFSEIEPTTQAPTTTTRESETEPGKTKTTTDDMDFITVSPAPDYDDVTWPRDDTSMSPAEEWSGGAPLAVPKPILYHPPVFFVSAESDTVSLHDACAVESAALFNAHAPIQVLVLTSRPRRRPARWPSDADPRGAAAMRAVLGGYRNMRVTMVEDDFFASSPLRELWQAALAHEQPIQSYDGSEAGSEGARQSFPAAVRLGTRLQALWEFGGAALDLRLLSLRNYTGKVDLHTRTNDALRVDTKEALVLGVTESCHAFVFELLRVLADEVDADLKDADTESEAALLRRVLARALPDFCHSVMGLTELRNSSTPSTSAPQDRGGVPAKEPNFAGSTNATQETKNETEAARKLSEAENEKEEEAEEAGLQMRCAVAAEPLKSRLVCRAHQRNAPANCAWTTDFMKHPGFSMEELCPVTAAFAQSNG